jgi:hypothetical protein
MHTGRHFVLILAAVIGLGVAAAPAFASTEQAAGAFVEFPETILEERQSGGNFHFHLTRDAAISGTYTGMGHADQYIVIHANGTFNFHQTIEFVGEVCGQAVSLTFLVVGRGDFNANLLTGHYTVIGGPPVGRGNGTITGEPGTGGTYEGQVHCD